MKLLSGAREARIRAVYRRQPSEEWLYLAREPFMGERTLDLAVKAGIIEPRGEDRRWYCDAYRLAQHPDTADLGDLWIE